MKIRPVEPGDVERLREVDRAAGQLFAEVGLADIAAHEPTSAEELLAYQAAGRAWAAVDDHGRPVAFVVVDVVDGRAHVEQISVHPDAARRGVGARLLDAVAGWARDQEMEAMTLLTFADVPWNGPYYRRLGFRTVADADLGPELGALRRAEAGKGLDVTRRIAMRREA